MNGPHPLHSHLLSAVEAGPAAALGGGKARRPSASRGFFSASLYTTWNTRHHPAQDRCEQGR